MPLMIISISLLFFVDQLTKYLIKSHLDLFQSIPIIPGILYFTRAHNTGGVFGILPGQTLFFAIGTAIILALLILSLFFIQYTPMQRLAAIFLISGALGNLFDRVYYGYVTDFLDIKIWPIFNLADTYVVIGVFFFLLHEFLQHRASRGT